MKITLFTSNKKRHNYLINLFSKFCDQLFVVQESEKKNPANVSEYHIDSKVMKKYFEKVENSQNKFFGNPHIDLSNKNLKIFQIPVGSLNQQSISSLSEFLNSDHYIVFGSSYIKTDLLNFLIENKAINIHMGVSPYYRGSACNFWALYDNNPQLVGATIHLLSKELDAGPVLYHAMSKIKVDPFDYTMSTVKSAFHSIAEKINDKSIFKINPENQDRIKEIRYSRKKEFNDSVVKEFLNRKIDLNSKPFDISNLRNPFFFD